jgi:CBS domain-containing protein
MVEHDIGSVVATSAEEPIGIVTERDILKKVTSRYCLNLYLDNDNASAGLIAITA